MKILLFTLLIMLFASCNNNKPVNDNKPGKVNDNKSENLLGLFFNYEKKEVTITVVSTGCTSKPDFSFIVNNNTLKIERIKKDECKAMPDAVNLIYSFEETGISADKKYTIANSFIANLNLANIH